MYIFFLSERPKKGSPVSVEVLIGRYSELVWADCLLHNNCEPKMCHYIKSSAALFKLKFRATEGKSSTTIDVPPIWHHGRSLIPHPRECDSFSP